MPSYQKKISIPGKSAQEIYDRVEKEFTSLLAMVNGTPFGKVEIEKKAPGRCFEIQSSFFNAKLQCVEGGADLQGTLSLMASPFRSKIDTGIEKWLKKAFPQA